MNHVPVFAVKTSEYANIITWFDFNGVDGGNGYCRHPGKAVLGIISVVGPPLSSIVSALVSPGRFWAPGYQRFIHETI